MRSSSASRQEPVSRPGLRGVSMKIRAGVFALIAACSLGEAATAHNVLVIDMNRVRTESRSGVEIRAASEELRSTLRDEIRTREEAIRNEERKLAEERATLEPAEFRQRVQAFEGQVIEQRKFAEDQSRRLQFAIRRAQARLSRVTQSLLARVMEQSGAELLLDKTQIVLAAEQYDITDEVISMLNEAVPDGGFTQLEAAPEE